MKSYFRLTVLGPMITVRGPDLQKLHHIATTSERVDPKITPSTQLLSYTCGKGAHVGALGSKLKTCSI